MKHEPLDEDGVLVMAVSLILDGKAEHAVKLLSDFYGVKPPIIKIGLPKRCSKALGCYVTSRNTIYLKSSREYMDPFVILHEFYHHIRSRLGKHRGTEKHADAFAMRAIALYMSDRE